MGIEKQPSLAVRLAELAAATRALGARPESQDIREQLLQVATELDRIIDGLAKTNSGH